MEAPGSLSHLIEDDWLSSWRLPSTTSNSVCAGSKQLYEKTLEIISWGFCLFLLLLAWTALTNTVIFPHYLQVKVKITQFSMQFFVFLELNHI